MTAIYGVSSEPTTVNGYKVIKMKGLAKIIEDIMMAITFAEAGELDTAREIMLNFASLKAI